MLPEVNVDVLSIVPYKRQLTAHKGSDSIKEREERIFAGSSVERSKVVGSGLIGVPLNLRTRRDRTGEGRQRTEKVI